MKVAPPDSIIKVDPFRFKMEAGLSPAFICKYLKRKIKMQVKKKARNLAFFKELSISNL